MSVSLDFKIWENCKSAFASDAELVVFLKDNQKRPAVVICPGGAYDHLSVRESTPIAKHFNDAGYHAFVLNYSVAPHAKHPQALLDLARAFCCLHEKADELHLDSEKIVLCGFSAGGHLAGSLAVHWNKPWLQQNDGITADFLKPAALILAYPVISSGKFAHKNSFKQLLNESSDPYLAEMLSLELQVGPQVPPTFIWHTCGDQSVPLENSLMFASALRQAGQSFEFHVFPEGGHGLALATAETEKIQPGVEVWFDLCLGWLSRTLA